MARCLQLFLIFAAIYCLSIAEVNSQGDDDENPFDRVVKLIESKLKSPKKEKVLETMKNVVKHFISKRSASIVFEKEKVFKTKAGVEKEFSKIPFGLKKSKSKMFEASAKKTFKVGAHVPPILSNFAAKIKTVFKPVKHFITKRSASIVFEKEKVFKTKAEEEKEFSKIPFGAKKSNSKMFEATATKTFKVGATVPPILSNIAEKIKTVFKPPPPPPPPPPKLEEVVIVRPLPPPPLPVIEPGSELYTNIARAEEVNNFLHTAPVPVPPPPPPPVEEIHFMEEVKEEPKKPESFIDIGTRFAVQFGSIFAKTLSDIMAKSLSG